VPGNYVVHFPESSQSCNSWLGADWEEIRELVTDSYRILAPTKLTALPD
jgi:hypothetical protein